MKRTLGIHSTKTCLQAVLPRDGFPGHQTADDTGQTGYILFFADDQPSRGSTACRHVLVEWIPSVRFTGIVITELSPRTSQF